MIELELQHALLIKQRDAAAESIIQLSDVLSKLPPQGVAAETATNPTDELLGRVCHAVSALMEVHLLELQMTHESFLAPIDELEANLKMAGGGDLAALSRAIPQASEPTPGNRKKQTT
jgi:hypothetical protein